MVTLRKILEITVLAILLISAPVVQAQEIKEKKLRFAMSVVAGHPLHQAAVKFSESVNQKSSGKMKVNIFLGSALGSDQQSLNAVRTGTLDIMTTGTNQLAGIDKSFMILDFPFLFENYDEAYQVLDGPAVNKMRDILPKYDLLALDFWDLGFRHVTNNRHPILKVDDLRGLKIRVQPTPIAIGLFNSLGANAIPMPFGELYNALETKTVDGQENPLAVIRAAKIYEVQKYLTIINISFTPMPILFSKQTWEKLSPAEREILRSAIAVAKVYHRKISREKENEDIAFLKKSSIQYDEMVPEEITLLRKKVQPMVDKYVKEIGDPIAKAIFAEIENIRGKK